MATLKLHVFAEGERCPMLHDERGVPLFFPTLFATTQLRNAGAAVNTIKNKLMDLVVLMRWEQMHGRDLLGEFSRGQFLSIPDIVSLRDFAALDMREYQEAQKRQESSEGKVSQLLEARAARVRSQPSVGKQQHYNRVSTFADYLEFAASAVTQHQNDPAIAAEIARMAKTIRKHRPRGLSSQQDDDPHAKSPPTELVEEFMDVGAVDSPRNPFKSPSVRLRNAILFGLLRHTGMRRGELLSLRIDQLDLGHEPLVWVRRNQDDAHDSRRYQPVTKTKERPLPLPDDLAIQIQVYILNHRAKVAPARKHPYLLVSHRRGSTHGQPLSESALGSQIMAKMREVNAEFSLIHPHALRHHFNYELSKHVDEHNAKARRSLGDNALAPITDANELDVRAFLNGHRNRGSGATYNQRHIRETSDKAIRGIQAGIARAGRKERSRDEDAN